MMVTRFAGAGLGLLAFAITAISGLVVQNPVTVTLSRSIFALFLFCFIGFLVGGAAEVVLAEHEKSRKSQIRERYKERPSGADDADPDSEQTGTEESSAAA